jgi:hypothetical protein
MAHTIAKRLLSNGNVSVKVDRIIKDITKHAFLGLVDSEVQSLQEAITHKTEAYFVEQFAIAINPVAEYVNIGQLLLDEQVKRGRSGPTLTFGETTQLAAGMSSKETSIKSKKNLPLRNIDVEIAEAPMIHQDIMTRLNRVEGHIWGNPREVSEERQRNWSSVIQYRYKQGVSFKCGHQHRKETECLGKMINLEEHIKKSSRQLPLKKARFQNTNK